LISTSVASILGGILGKIDLRYPFMIALPFYIILIPLSLSIYEPTEHKKLALKNNALYFFKSIKKNVIQNPKIIQIFIISAIIGGAIGITYFLYQPYFKLSGLDIVYFGLVFAAFNFVMGLSSKYSYIIEKQIGINFSLVLSFLLVSLCFILMGNFIFIFSFLFAFLFQFVGGFSSIVIGDYIHREIESKIRATVCSVQSVFNSCFQALIAPLIGWLVDVYTLPQTLTIVGIIILLFGIVFSVLLYKDKLLIKE